MADRLRFRSGQVELHKAVPREQSPIALGDLVWIDDGAVRPHVVRAPVPAPRDPGGLRRRRPTEGAVLVRPADEAHGVVPHPAAHRALRDALDAATAGVV